MRFFPFAIFALVFSGACVSSRNNLIESQKLPGEFAPVSFAHCYADDRHFYALGGIPAKEPFSPFNSLGITYSASDKSWVEWPTLNGPAPKSYFATAMGGDSVFVFGGQEGGVSFTRDLFAFDVSRGQWRKEIGSEELKARISPTLLTAEENLVVFGGKTADQKNNWGVYSPRDKSWKIYTNTPSDRTSHIALSLGSRVFIWGGFENNRRSSEGFILNSATGEKVEIAPSPLAPRANARGLRIANRIFVFGGTTSDGWVADGAAYDLDSNTWLKIPSMPDTRSAFEITLTPDGEILVWGGRESSTKLAAGVLLFNPQSLSWRRVEWVGPPSNRQAHCLGNMGERFYVFGGLGDKDNASKFSNRLWLIPFQDLEKKK